MPDEVGRAGVAERRERVDQTERTAAGVFQRAVAALLHEEATTLDRHVEDATATVDVALSELLGHRRQVHTVADAVLAGAQFGRGVDVGEFRTGRLEASGRDVGDVVASHVQLFVGRIEAAKADIKRHVSLPLP